MSILKTKSGMQRSVKKRVSPGLTKVRKSITLSRMLWSKVDIFAEKNGLNRSQSLEKGMVFFLSRGIHETIAELQATKVKVAMLEQEIKNAQEIKALLEKKIDL